MTLIIIFFGEGVVLVSLVARLRLRFGVVFDFQSLSQSVTFSLCVLLRFPSISSGCHFVLCAGLLAHLMKSSAYSLVIIRRCNF
eukprot:g5262.t1